MLERQRYSGARLVSTLVLKAYMIPRCKNIKSGRYYYYGPASEFATAIRTDLELQDAMANGDVKTYSEKNLRKTNVKNTQVTDIGLSGVHIGTKYSDGCRTKTDNFNKVSIKTKHSSYCTVRAIAGQTEREEVQNTEAFTILQGQRHVMAEGFLADRRKWMYTTRWLQRTSSPNMQSWQLRTENDNLIAETANLEGKALSKSSPQPRICKHVGHDADWVSLGKHV